VPDPNRAPRSSSASQEALARAFCLSPAAITITALSDGRLLEVNDRFLELSGYSREEAVGRNPVELGLWLDPGERRRGLDELQAERPIRNREVRFRAKDGTIVDCLASAELVLLDGQPCALSVISDITERKLVEEQRERLVGELQRLDRRKDEFLATLSHELRNSLAPIRNAIELLGRAPGDEGASARAREVLDRQVEHLSHLVDDLLDISRIRSGKVRLNTRPVELSPILAAAVEASRPLIETRKHQLSVAYPTEPIWLDVDPIRLAQVVTNLLNNAAKFTERGGRISLSTERSDSRVEISVRDDGIGIPADLLPTLFDLFTRATRSLDGAEGGLGIGLNLVKNLVELHGGTVRAESGGDGQGTALVVSLPLSGAAVTPRDPDPGEERDLSGQGPSLPSPT
jgi:PAS domain S-box-containing protein